MVLQNFFTTIWRLERTGHFKLLANTHLGFPLADFFHVNKNSVEVNFFNLVGVDSPLPHYLLALAIRHPAFANFVKIFNEQFYQLLYASWKKLHPLANQGGYQQLLSQFMGLEQLSMLSFFIDGWLLSPGIVGLQKCLKKLLGSIPFSLTEYASDWFELDHVIKLGDNSYLNNCLMGQYFFTDQYGVDCQIGPLQIQQSVDVVCVKELLHHFAVRVKIKVLLLFDDTAIRLGNIKLGQSYLFAARQTFQV